MKYIKTALKYSNRAISKPLHWIFEQSLGRFVDWSAMQSLGRVIRMTFRYKYSLVMSFFCSFMVGVLWGGNISALYPFVEVVFRGESFHVWIDRQVSTSEKTCADLTASHAALEAKLKTAPPKQQKKIREEIAGVRSRLGSEQAALARSRKQQPIIKKYLPKDPFLDLVVVVSALMLGTLAKSMFLVGSILFVTRARQMALFDLQNQFFQKTLRMDVATISNDRTSGLLSRFTYDIRLLEQGLGSLLGAGVREPLKMAACLFGAAMISWQLLIASFLVLPIGLLAMRKLTKAMMKYSGRNMDVVAAIYARITEAFNEIKIVKAFTMEKHEEQRFHDTTKEYTHICLRFTKYFALFKPVSETMGIAVVSMAILTGAYLVLNGETHIFGIKMSDRPLSAASLLMFFGLLAGSADPARKMSGLLGGILAGAIASQRIMNMMDREPAIREAENPVPLPDSYSALIFENVQFHYQEGEPVIKNLNLQIANGETIALVGQNGCGKSTLANMVPRFYEPVKGAIRFGDTDIRQVRLHELRQRIGIVTQETSLFDEPIMENIRYGSPHATDEQVIQAAKKAYAHDFITDILEEGYQTIVGEGGGRLSGGQRQRIALARAILRDPQIFILDEATSQVDLESERLIHKVLEEFVRGRTTIIISHRLSTLKLASRIAVMEAGQIVDCGTHEQLMARCKNYRQLHESQQLEAA